MHAEPTPIQVASPANDARRHGSIDEAVADRDALAALHSAVDSD